ncbi:M3 family metallopeptidase [Robiginitalea sp. IMCC44478]|uniref:M3 family metallopeptidase n=1 Tax=Robiginitalea sp. IMCC44478 TaxID=3459122 RepID=UPI0040416E35
MKNPLLDVFDLSPFSAIKTSDFKPAFESAIETARQEIDAITQNPETPTFENTIAALDYSGYQLDRISSIFFNLNSAETNPEIQALAQEISPMLSEFSNDITLNQALFKRVKAVYDQTASLNLNPEEEMLLDKKYRHFQRNGALLGEDDKAELRKIDAELSKLKLTFGEHVLEETNRFELVLEDAKELQGLPEAIREQAAELAKQRNKKGWVFTLDYPSYIPFMKYSARRELRKKMALAFGSKGFHGDQLDNREIVLKIAGLRHQRAKLLGFESHAHFVLAERMAKSPEAVQDFLKELLEKALPAAERDLEELKEFAKETGGISELQKWDNAYYSEKLKQQKHALDDEILKPYFPLESVLEGVFTVAGKLFGLRFQEAPEVDKYHKEVRVFRVFDQDNKFISLFYADFHPRPGKRGGAWMTSYKPQFRRNGTDERPHISIVCNFSRPNGNIPSLLTFNEVTTLFHEFGHALHGMLANTTYPGLSGTSVYWDFVELPSQIMENWCYEPDALKLFAKHYQSGEIIPDALVEKIKASANFQEGMATVRQISFGLLDMAWHGSDPSEVKDVKQYEQAAFGKTQLFPDHPDTCMSTSFSHIFQGGYSSGYYSYKWAEVLDADAFAFFKEKGIFNAKIASLFREHILSRGGTEDPMELYKRFRGREPDIQALLERAGLLETH